MSQSTVVLIHATPNSMAPVSAAFAEGLPDVRVRHLLDEGLLTDRSLLGPVQPMMRQRMARVVQLALDTNPDVVLLTCSAYTSIADWLRQLSETPILFVDEELARAASERGRRVGIISTHRGSVALIEAAAAARGVVLDLRTIIVRDAFDALTAGRGDEHDRLMAARAAELADCDTIVFAQASMTRALPTLPAPLREKVLTSPTLAVDRVRTLLSR